MRTRFLALAAAAALSPITLTGCGGGSNSGGSSINASPFVGTSRGTFYDATNGGGGLLTLTVDGSGNVTGTTTNITPDGSVTGTITGTVDGSGDANLTYTYPGSTTSTAKGQITKNGSGQYTGSFTEYNAGTQFGTASVVLTPGAATPYTGHYVGTFNDAANELAGTLNVQVASTGSVSGTLTTEGETAQIVGTMDAGGNVNLTYTYPNSPSLGARGAVSLNPTNGHLTGSVGEYQGTTQVGTAAVDLTRQ